MREYVSATANVRGSDMKGAEALEAVFLILAPADGGCTVLKDEKDERRVRHVSAGPGTRSGYSNE